MGFERALIVPVNAEGGRLASEDSGPGCGPPVSAATTRTASPVFSNGDMFYVEEAGIAFPIPAHGISLEELLDNSRLRSYQNLRRFSRLYPDYEANVRDHRITTQADRYEHDA